MRNFGQLGFKNYLDSYYDPSVWNSPRLIVQLDRLTSVFERNDDVLDGEGFQLRYDLIILDESESLLAHLDEQTMTRKEIGIWNFFDDLLKHSGNMLLMDGDIRKQVAELRQHLRRYDLRQQQEHGRPQGHKPDAQ